MNNINFQFLSIVRLLFALIPFMGSDETPNIPKVINARDEERRNVNIGKTQATESLSQSSSVSCESTNPIVFFLAKSLTLRDLGLMMLVSLKTYTSRLILLKSVSCMVLAAFFECFPYS